MKDDRLDSLFGPMIMEKAITEMMFKDFLPFQVYVAQVSSV